MPSKPRQTPKKSPAVKKVPAGKKKPAAAPQKRRKLVLSPSGSPAPSEESDASDESDVYKEEEDDEHLDDEDEDDASIHSDDLDAEDVDAGKKRKRGGTAASKSPKKSKSTPKKRKSKRSTSDDEDEDSELELEEGQEIVGRLIVAPKTGRVPPGQISHNTFNFLRDLKKPECNDREWFKLRDPVYRVAEKEWVDFVDNLTTKLTEVDDEIPPLPSKDLIHRIYRDIRFSNDKTPYKTNFSASWSRTGRKGIFAHYHVSISPGGGSIVAAGLWCPGKNELATIRAHIIRDSSRLRSVIEDKAFVKMFGPAKPHPKGERQNIFGHEDDLKVAPKGVDKTHKDIDLLKLRTVAVVHRFMDSEVTDPKFADNVCKVSRVMMPLVHLLNEMITLPPDDEE